MLKTAAVVEPEEENKMAFDKTDLEEDIARKIYHQFVSQRESFNFYFAT